MPHRKQRWFSAVAGWLLLAATAPALADVTTTLQVHLKLVTADSAPLVGVPVRLVLANGADWQGALAGERLVSDEKGEIHWSTRGTVEHRQRKLPSNFFSQLVSSAQETVHFSVAAQLPFLGREWLFVTSVDYFASGASVQFDGIRLYGMDGAGAFNVAVTRDAAGWHFPGVAWPVSDPGYQVASLSVAPSGAGWTVALTMRRLPEPVVR